MSTPIIILFENSISGPYKIILYHLNRLRKF
jgi:hypothetical protein